MEPLEVPPALVRQRLLCKSLITELIFPCKVGIRLTQVAPIGSMRGGGRISPRLDGIGSELRHRGGLPSVLGAVAMARWFSLSTLWGQSVLAGA